MIADFHNYLNLLEEIEANTWWTTHFKQNPIRPASFTYTIDEQGERITDVPSESVESLLLRVRRLTMNNSTENLHRVCNQIKGQITNDNLRRLLDSWHHYWRLALIKEPYLIQCGGLSQVMTPYKVYDAFINGKHFHTEPGYQIILYGAQNPAKVRSPSLFLQNQFHSVVASMCMAALGLRLFFNGDQPWILSGHVSGVIDFVWCRHQIPQMTEQYEVFNKWVEERGGCSNCRW